MLTTQETSGEPLRGDAIETEQVIRAIEHSTMIEGVERRTDVEGQQHRRRPTVGGGKQIAHNSWDLLDLCCLSLSCARYTLSAITC